MTRDGKVHEMEFARGVATGPIKMHKAPSGSSKGTKIRFWPDATIFKTTVDFDFDRLATRFDELAYLNAGVTLRFPKSKYKWILIGIMDIFINKRYNINVHFVMNIW